MAASNLVLYQRSGNDLSPSPPSAGTVGTGGQGEHRSYRPSPICPDLMRMIAKVVIKRRSDHDAGKEGISERSPTAQIKATFAR